MPGSGAILTTGQARPCMPIPPRKTLAGNDRCSITLCEKELPHRVCPVATAGTSPYKMQGYACGNQTPDCQRIIAAVNAEAASAVRADANGKATFPAVSQERT